MDGTPFLAEVRQRGLQLARGAPRGLRGRCCSGFLAEDWFLPSYLGGRSDVSFGIKTSVRRQMTKGFKFLEALHCRYPFAEKVY